MAISILNIPGSQIVQKDQPYENLVFNDQEGVLYAPNPDIEDQQDAYFTHNIAPPVMDNFAWNQIKINWTRSYDNVPNIFEALFTLEGINLDGSLELIGEKIITDISSSSVTEDILFDLYNSRTTPAFRKIGTGAPTGKIQVNLPKRWLYFQSINLKRAWLDGWSKRKRINVTSGSSTWYSSYVVRNITVTYDSDMNSDFSDVRFTDKDGRTLLCSERESYTSSTSAVFNVLVPELANGETRTIYMYYGNSAATIQGNPFNIFTYYDDLEDGLYTGRSSPYLNWTSRTGTLSIESTSPITGAYSLKHQSSGTLNYGSVYFPYNHTSYEVSFDFKLTSQGSATNTPYVNLWYIAYEDSDSWMRIDTYWSGSYQILRLVKNNNGSLTTYGTWNWRTSKLPTGTIYNIRIVDSMNSNCKVYVDGTLRINASYSTTLVRDTFSLGCNADSGGVWDNFRFSTLDTGISTGAFGSEESTILVGPDTPSEDDTSILYSTPSDWTGTDPASLETTEIDTDEYDTKDVLVTPLDVLEHGYNGIDRYVGLKLGLNLQADINCNVRINSLSGAYEVI